MWGRGKKEEEAKEQQAAAAAAEAAAQAEAKNAEIRATMTTLQKQLGDATAEVSKLKRELEDERKAKDAIAKELAAAKKEAADAKKAADEAKAGAAKVTAQAAAPTAAPAAAPTGMAIGATVVVTGTGADKLRRRDAPGLNSQILDMMLEDGTRLKLLDGPVAVDGYNWWYVRQEGNNAMAVVAGEYLKPA